MVGLFILLCLSYFTTGSYGLINFCSSKLLSKCLCGVEEYNYKQEYVVNCSNTGFTDAKALQDLPPETQVLIFTGNYVSELPLNVFGTRNNNSNLRIIDLSNNNIKTIKGKTFHHVPNVQRLILNHNEISISSDDPTHHHPRIFSNFENLLELHLTDAFVDNSPEGLAADLHDIFFSSELTKLHKLHLEQNEIMKFNDSRVFCDLPAIQDLHLGQNSLTGIHFELNCLKNLRYLDLENNLIHSFKSEDLNQLDTIQKKQNLTIDIRGNPFACDCDRLYLWLNNTNVTVRYKNKIQCRRSLQSNKSPIDQCKPPVLNYYPITVQPINDNFLLISFLLILLIISIGLNVYSNKKFLKDTLTPTFQTITKKVHYTTIGKTEDQEMDV